MRTPTGRIGFVLVALTVLAALLAPLIAPYAPSALDVANRFSPPSLPHLLGTDHLGRDLLSRILYGSQIALGTSLSLHRDRRSPPARCSASPPPTSRRAASASS